ncbi:uncharacterized [Tachysurus ichikawai]
MVLCCCARAIACRSILPPHPPPPLPLHNAFVICEHKAVVGRSALNKVPSPWTRLLPVKSARIHCSLKVCAAFLHVHALLLRASAAVGEETLQLLFFCPPAERALLRRTRRVARIK